MTKFLVHRCRLYDFTPCAIHGIAASGESSDLAVSRSNGNIEIWSTTPNLLQKMVIPGSGSSVEALQWVGDRLISAQINGELTEYDMKSATSKFSVDSYGGAVWCLSCSPDQKQLAAGCEDGSVKLFDLKNESITFEKALDKQEARILSMSWHVSGNVIVTGSVDIIRLWSVKTGHALQKISIERLSHKMETIMWSVIVLSDYTVISGDSCGRVQFWNGKNGTLLNSHQAHRADVLCLCRGNDESTIYAAGVDPKVIEFNLVSSKTSTTWVVGRQMHRHSHDIRAIAKCDGRLFSGGVDGRLCTKPIRSNSKQNNFFQSYSFPLRNHVSVSRKEKLLLLQYPNHLDLWKIAQSSVPEDLKLGQSVAIDQHPIKLIKVKTPSSDVNVISCSSISPCGRWLAYSTATTTRLYRIFQEEGEILMKIDRIHCIGMTSAHVILFTPDSSRMIVSTTNHKLLFITLDSEVNNARIDQTVSLKSTNTVTHLLAASSDSSLLACASLNGMVEIFDIHNASHVYSLPRHQDIPTAMSFISKSKRLMIAYANMKAIKVDLNEESKKYGRILDTFNLLDSRKLSNKKYHAVATNIFHCTSGGISTHYLVTTEGLYVIEKNGKERRIRFRSGFALLLYGDLLDDDALFLVERTLHDIYSQLPPTLYEKKFGL